MEQKQFEALLSDAETRLRRLKMLYEQWFAGFERVEPAVARKEVDDLLQRLRREQIRNTGLRFRLQQLVQRHTTFTTYWRRIARQIEEGTYQRDVLKAKKLRDQLARDGAEPEISYGGDVDVQVDPDMDAALEDVLREAEVAAERATAAKRPAVVEFAADGYEAEAASGAGAKPAAASTSLPVQAPRPAGAAPTLSMPVPPAAAGAKKAPPPPPRPPAGPRSISPFAMPLPPVPAVPHAAKPATAGAATAAAAARPAPPAPPSAAGAVKPATAAGGGAGLSSDDLKRIYDRYVAARKQNSERTDNVKIETIEKSLRGMLPQFEKKHAGKKIDFEVVVKDGKVALKPVAK